MGDLQSIHACCTLWRLPRVGAKRYAAIVNAFGSAEHFLALPERERRHAGVTIEADALDAARRGADTDVRWLRDHADARIITLGDGDYPPALMTIADPPPVLFVRGDAALLTAPQLAVVGSRSASHEGLDNARNFSQYLTSQGIVITSGLATGVDGAAHEGALSHKVGDLCGQTIAVMGTGADRVYPAKHRELAYSIIEHGCVITELPIGTPVTPQAFPRRNRIISGLSLGTLVVEASMKSGSLITARTALEQNREVFALPGSIHNPLARGCNHLIKNGAKLVETAQDIFEELRPALSEFVQREEHDVHHAASSERGESSQVTDEVMSAHCHDASVGFAHDPDKQALWEALSHDPQPIDVLAERSGLAVNQVSSMLLIMELGGAVNKHPGGRFQKKMLG